MTILAFLAGLVGIPEDKIREMLNAAAAANPDAAAFYMDLLAKLDASVTSDALASLAAALPSELKNTLLGHLDPKRHPSDFA